MKASRVNRRRAESANCDAKKLLRCVGVSQAGAVEFDEGTVRMRAERVQNLGNRSFAGSGFTQDQDRALVAGQMLERGD